MPEIVIRIPEESALLLRVPVEELGRKLQMAAVKPHEMGGLSSGAAAQLAGMPRAVFLSGLADYGSDTFRLSRDELQTEARLA